MNGSRFSCSRQNMMRGRTKTRVFPDPVNAIPIMSRPANLKMQRNDYRDELVTKCQFLDQWYICHISKRTRLILTKFTVYLYMYEKKVVCHIISNFHDCDYGNPVPAYMRLKNGYVEFARLESSADDVHAFLFSLAAEVHCQRPPAGAQWLHICTMPIVE